MSKNKTATKSKVATSEAMTDETVTDLLLAHVQLANRLAQCLTYSWPWDFCQDEIKDAKKRLTDNKVIKKIPTSLSDLMSSTDLQALEFRSRLSKDELVILSHFIEVYNILKQMISATADIRPQLSTSLNRIIVTSGQEIAGTFERIGAEGVVKFGFGRWNDEVTNDSKTLMLVPIYACYMLPVETPIRTIFNAETLLGSLDKDTRWGCLAGGLMLKTNKAPKNKD